MSNITAIKPARAMPDDFPKILRDLADAVEAGRVTQFVAMWASDGEYHYEFPSSFQDSLVLASLLQHRAASRFLL